MASEIFVGYVLAFGLAAAACFAGLFRITQIRDDDVRVGLSALLVTSGGWAAAHVGYLLVPSVSAKLAFYLLGLVIGFAAVGAWLYFCSAYTGRTYHRQRPYRYLAAAIFVGIVLLKLTNPIHSLYFTSAVVSTPFHHLAVSHRFVHWIVMAFAYALSFVGFFMLFERFISVGLDTTPLVALVGITALPVGFDILAIVSPALVSMTYEPIGVAVFAVGVLFVYHERFQAVTLAAETDVPVIFLDAEHRVRDFNRQARSLFPALAESHGEALSTVSEQLAEAISTDGRVIEDSSATGTRYYLASTTPFGVGEANTGYLLALTEVTETEQYRRELERKTNRLEQFASVVSHDLRNPLSVAQGYVQLARENPDDPEEDLQMVADAHARMEALIEDLLALAREGQVIEEPEEIALSELLERCWRNVETTDATLLVDVETTILADPDRLQQLFENLFRNAVEHGGSTVTVTVGELSDGFYIEDDGPGISEDERHRVFEFGYSTSERGTGFGLAIVQEIVGGHGWTIDVTESEDGGARFEIRNVEINA